MRQIREVQGEEYGEWVLVRIRAQREGMGSTSGIPLSFPVFPVAHVILCHCHCLCLCVSLCGSLLPSSSFLLWYSFPLLSFFLFPPVVFLSLVILLLPCIPCLFPASSHAPIHSLIRLHGYPFAITDNRLTGPHTLRYAITRK